MRSRADIVARRKAASLLLIRNSERASASDELPFDRKRIANGSGRLMVISPNTARSGGGRQGCSLVEPITEDGDHAQDDHTYECLKNPLWN